MVRSARKEDAARIIEVLKQSYQETEFLSCEADEFDISVTQEEAFIESKGYEARSLLYVIEDEGMIVGTCALSAVSDRKRLKHKATVGINIIHSAWHKGLGTEALERAIEDARKMNFEMILLEVYAKNIRAIALYEKLGFIRYGYLEKSTKLEENRYDDEIMMVKYL